MASLGARAYIIPVRSRGKAPVRGLKLEHISQDFAYIYYIFDVLLKL